MSELQILSHSPRVLFYVTANIFIRHQGESIRVPDEYVMSVKPTHPDCPYSTAIRRCCRLCSTAVQLQQKVLHDVLPCLRMLLSQVEDFADARRIGAFVAYHVADFCGQILLGMMLFFGLYVPADVVECQPVEVAVADQPSTVDIAEPFCRSYHIKSRLCSTTKGALHGCRKRDGLEHYAKNCTGWSRTLSSIVHKCIKHYDHATPERLIGVYVLMTQCTKLLQLKMTVLNDARLCSTRHAHSGTCQI